MGTRKLLRWVLLLVFMLGCSTTALASYQLPTKHQIEADLIGRSIKAPKSSYFYGHSWKILKGEYVHVEILNSTVTSSEITYKLRLTLRADEMGSLQSECTFVYTKNNDGSWSPLMLQAQTYEAIQTGRYEGCIDVAMCTPMLSLGDYLCFDNNCDVKLVVAVRLYDGYEWKKTHIILPPAQRTHRSELSIEDYRVDYVELAFY